MKLPTLISWILRIVTVLILAQTLPYKFTGAEESKALFTQLGIEPFGRIGIGVMELIACILLLVPKTMIYGALLTAGLMAGALFSHLTVLGFSGPMLPLASVAGVALICSGVLLLMHRQQIPVIGKLFR